MKIRAFVLDDDEDMRSIVSSMLEERGYEVLAFSQPLNCKVFLERGCPCPRGNACGDIFLIDINMPGMNGLEFIEHQVEHGCKAMAQNKAIMSAHVTDEQRKEAKRLGCEVLVKPLAEKRLGRWLDRCEKRIDPDRKLADLEELFGKQPDHHGPGCGRRGEP